MRIGMIIVYIGSSIILAMGLFRWQYNTSNRVIFIGILARILVFIYRCIGMAVISFIGYRHLGTHITI